MFHESILSIVYLNIISYIYLNFAFFALIFIFDTKQFISLSDLKNLGNLQFFSVTVILLFLAFAGVPPTLGFVSKSLIFVFIFLKKFFFFFFFISVVNFFIIYFYIKNLRFLVTKSNNFNFIFNKNYSCFNQNLVLFVNIINFINLLSIYYIEDLIIFIDNFVLLSNFF